MKNCTLIIFIFLTYKLSAQTKLIFHKSHSGNLETFKIALENKTFDLDKANFGEAPQKVVRNAKLDSVIYVSDSVAIMVTSEYCRFREDNYETEKLWKAGRDTLRRHALFSKKHSLDSIKRIVRNEYYFRNSVEEVKFVGFDNKSKKAKRKRGVKKEEFAPVGYYDKPDYPNALLYALVAGILLLASGLGFLAYRFRKFTF